MSVQFQKRRWVILLCGCLLCLISIQAAQAPKTPQTPAPLSPPELGAITGTGFLNGVGCGFALVGTAIAVVSPDPFSKLALAAYFSTVVACGAMVYEELA